MSVNLMSISPQDVEFLPSNLLGILHNCLWVADNITAIVWRRYCGIIAPWFPVRQGLQSSQKD